MTDPLALSYGMGVDSTTVSGSWRVFLAEHAPEVLPELPPEQPQPATPEAPEVHEEAA